VIVPELSEKITSLQYKPVMAGAQPLSNKFSVNSVQIENQPGKALMPLPGPFPRQ
jgi:hypothetical protein